VQLSREHEALLTDYARELEAAVHLALDERETKIQSVAELEGVEESAARERLEVSPIAADGFVVAVIRKFWLALEELNRTSPAELRVDPEAFLEDELGRRNLDMGNIIAALPYWPVGEDADGRRV